MTAPALIVLMPSRTAPRPETIAAIEAATDGISCTVRTVVGRPVCEARDRLWWLAGKIAKHSAGSASEIFVLQLDDDLWFGPGAIRRLISTLKRRADVDILCVPYCARQPFRPLVIHPAAGGVVLDPAELRRDTDGLLPVRYANLGFVIHRADALEKLGDGPFSRTCGDEDSFFREATQLGLTMFLDLETSLVHVDEDGYAFLPNSAPGRIIGNRFELCPEFMGEDRAEVLKHFQLRARRF